jgi:hypothetical protein
VSPILGYAIMPRTIDEITGEVLAIISEARRLQLRGYTPEEAAFIMCRRVDRYFRTGKFVPLAKLAVD